ncbi:MAG: ThiF family adenylyltransferase [Dehalococcoidales bacterium]
MYRLSNDFAQGHFTVTVVGCGGTGGFAAEGLCRLLPPRADLVLIDHDRIEERNLLRQNFTRENLGQFKSESLAKALAQRYGRPIAYSTLPVEMAELRCPGLIIGCVDNGLAREQIAERIKGKELSWVGGYSQSVPIELQQGPRLETDIWWVDAGNGENYGQILIGNTDVASHCITTEDIYMGLPLPTIQKPELLLQAPTDRDCASIAEEQGPTINLTVAAVVVEVVRRLIDGTCSWVQLYLDMEAGTLIPVFATPETIKSLSQRKGGKP